MIFRGPWESPENPSEGANLFSGPPNRRNSRKSDRFLHARRGNIEFSLRGALADRLSLDFLSIFARFSDVRASRSGSTLAANFNRLGFERATPDPHESMALPYFRKGRPCRSESTRFSKAARKTAKIDPKIDPRSASAVSNAKPRKTTKIDQKSDSKSLRMDARSLSGDLRGRLSGIFGAGIIFTITW